jgi:hypothetical protein
VTDSGRIPVAYQLINQHSSGSGREKKIKQEELQETGQPVERKGQPLEPNRNLLLWRALQAGDCK